MRNKLFSIALYLILSCTYAFSQYGYYCGDEFIELKPTDKGFFIQTNNEATIQTLNKLMEKESSGENDNKSINFIADGMYYSSSIDFVGDEDYVSYIYNNKLGGQIVVLPRILFALKKGFTLEDFIKTVEKEESILEIELSNKRCGIYGISCASKSSTEVLNLVSKMQKIQCIEWCEPNKLSDGTYANSNPLFSQQYYLCNNSSNYDLNVTPVWSFLNGGDSDITVAIIDSGVDLFHEDLSNNILPGYTVDNVTRYGQPLSVMFEQFRAHGTACAGIVAALDNNLGIKGIANNIKILPINISPNRDSYITPNGLASYEKIAEAITWASERADILSCSWTFKDSPTVIINAINNARINGRNGKGCVVIAATGNNYQNGRYEASFPANVNGVLSVGAIDRNGNICDYSQRGSNLDLVAFGGYSDIVTLDITGELGYNHSLVTGNLANKNYTKLFWGTSAACPQVAGIAALMLSINPMLTESQVRAKLCETARDLGSYGYDTTYGYGLVDAYSAVLSAACGNRIIGAHLIDTSCSYSVENLASGLTVEWSLSDGYYNQNCLQQNYPTTNQCTITRSNLADMRDATLTATIKYNGNIVKTLDLENINAYHGFKGSYNSLNTSGEINSPLINVAANCCTYIYSPNLFGATISYSNSAAAPYLSNFLPEYGTLVVGVSGNNNNIPVQVNINDVCGNNYTLTLMPHSSPYSINIAQQQSGINITIEENNASISERSLLSHSWTCEVRNASLGTLMSKCETSDTSIFISTDGWTHGTYLINITIGEETITYKVIN